MRNPLRRFRTESKVDAALLSVHPGYSILRRCDEIGAETLIDHNDKEDVYRGVMPHVVEMHPDIIPLPWFQKKIYFRKVWRIRLHKRLAHEPFTRDLYTGEILNPAKKAAVLLEKGVIDYDGFLLDANGNRVYVSSDPFVYVKVDVTDIDFIKAEFKAVKESELVVEAAKSMAKTGKTFEKEFYYILALAMLIVGFIGFLALGGANAIGL
jgi:hypothetical protein